MAATESTQILSLGATAPDFRLNDVVTGQEVSLETFAGSKALLVAFASPHCPYVKHVQGELKRISDDYGPRGAGFAIISANDIETHPADGPEGLAAWKSEQGYAFPVLFDETQEVAKAYHAACTPDFFLFDNTLALVYRGQLDSTRPKTEQVANGQDVRAALDAVLSGQPVAAEQRPSIGCNIKWKPGNEPAYFVQGVTRSVFPFQSSRY
jgi:peroxiredoxin